VTLRPYFLNSVPTFRMATPEAERPRADVYRSRGVLEVSKLLTEGADCKEFRVFQNL
jgi:hypothetical protein